MKSSPFTFIAHGSSDIGLARPNNEDVWSAIEEEDYGLFILADGMGGHQAGEIAAKEAVNAVCISIDTFFQKNSLSQTPKNLSSLSKTSIEMANRWVYQLGKKKKEYRGMGTTVCTLLFHHRSVIHGNVGDSRIYRFRKGILHQLTVDHSLKNALISQGKLSDSPSRPFPHKNILTRAIGTHPEVIADVAITQVNPGDVYLMCSDGLTDYVDDKNICNVLKEDRNPKTVISTLIECAKEKKGNDNITIVMIRVDEDESKDLPGQQCNNTIRSTGFKGDAPRFGGNSP